MSRTVPVALVVVLVAVLLLLLFAPLWLKLTALAVIYAAGFLLTLVVNLVPLGMVTFRLALLRSLLWPVWIVTGRPRGEPLPMD